MPTKRGHNSINTQLNRWTGILLNTQGIIHTFNGKIIKHLSWISETYLLTRQYVPVSGFTKIVRQVVIFEHGCSKSRISNQNGVSLLYIMLEIHHSGRKPSKCKSNQQNIHFITIFERKYWNSPSGTQRSPVKYQNPSRHILTYKTSTFAKCNKS